MVYRAAASSCLNTLPLTAGLARSRSEEVRLLHAPSSCLAELLLADAVDVALLPVVEHFRGYSAGIVPGIGISSRGASGNVRLFTRVEPEAIDRVAVDRNSRTSVALLRLLLAELYGVRPDFFVWTPSASTFLQDAPAALVVSDRCFELERDLQAEDFPDVKIFDLDGLWSKWTGLPFVFATWALGKSFLSQRGPAGRDAVTRLLLRARTEGLADLDQLIEQAVGAGRCGPGGTCSCAEVRHYFDASLRFTLGEEEMAGLHRFYELCLRHAVCPAGRAPQLATLGEGS